MNMVENLSLAESVALREAEVLGQPQRIEPLPVESFDEPARALVKEIRETLVKGATAEIPEFFGVMLHHPALFRCQIDTCIEMLGRGTMPVRDRELAILRVGWLAGAPYEWGEHVWVGKSAGVTAEEIERITLGSAAEGWSDHDAAVLRAVEEMVEAQMISDATWQVLAASWSERQLIEFIMVVGQYLSTAILQNALRIRLGATNPGLKAR